MNKNVIVITEPTGKKIVLINDLCFKGKTILKGPNLKAKANAAQAIGELIEVAENKSVSEDFKEKHGEKAKYGWYRYDTRLALPVYNDEGEIQRYNIYKLRMLVRYDEKTIFI